MRSASFRARLTGIVPAAASILVLVLFAAVEGPRSTFAAQADAKGEATEESTQIDPLDWPAWRGPEQNGISRELGLVDRWSPSGENLIWKSEELATRSTPIVMRGKLYTLARSEPDTPREGEQIICADAATGKILWRNKFNVYLSDVPDTRVAWSCCVGDPATGRVYAMGVCGYFQCVDGETGETIWSRSLSEEFGLLSTYGGRTNTPIVFEDMVIISGVLIGWGDAARPTHRYLAFDKNDGTVLWVTGTRPLPDDTTYSVPCTAVIDGQAVMVFGSGDGSVWGLQPRTGKPLWEYKLSQRGLNTSPIIVGDVVYTGQSEENRDDSTMGAFVAFRGVGEGDITQSAELWRDKEVMVGKCSPLLVGGKLYGVDDSNAIYTVDPVTGKQIGRPLRLAGTISRASPLYADGKLYVCTTSAWHVLQQTENSLKILHRMRLPGTSEVYGSPIVSHGRIYLPTTEAMYCIGKKDAVPSADPQPQPPVETAVAENPDPAFLQVLPAEVLVHPGESVQFKARTFNRLGQLLSETDAVYEVDGPGDVNPQGLYVADSQASHVAATVKARLGKLEGTARVRIVPDMPWKFDFTDGQIPVSWVGARYRHVPLDIELYDKLRAENPRAAMLYVYLMSSFVNGPNPEAASFDASFPRQTWRQMLIYLGLENSAETIDQAREALAPGLDVLVRQGVLAGWELVQDPKLGIKLGVKRGSRRTDENTVMAKITTIPKGTRSQGWMGHDDAHDYTISADVRGATRPTAAGEASTSKMPDIGLIAQRYTLDLMGASQQLQIRSWTPELDRFSASVPYAWQPETWYSLKFRAAVEDGKAVLKGKVWPRGEPEPKTWTIEAEDLAPNVVGSPGLYGNAKDSEIFVDNVEVLAN